jgi:hypothetical protein
MAGRILPAISFCQINYKSSFPPRQIFIIEIRLQNRQSAIENRKRLSALDAGGRIVLKLE